MRLTPEVWAMEPESNPPAFRPLPPEVVQRGEPYVFVQFGPVDLYVPGARAAFENPRRHVGTWPREFESPALGWRGFVWVASQDEERLLVALRAAEGVIFFLLGRGLS
jgi:hypothetical protein